MANPNLFKSAPSSKANPPKTNTTNSAGGRAYKFDDRHKLAQIACSNCFNGTYYTSADDNLKLAKEAALALKKDAEFIAKVAVYSRDKGYMKDMPSFLTVALADFDKVLFRKVFRKVVNNGKMLRNVIMMARSGQVTGKKFNMSAGTFRHAIQEWFDAKSPHALFKASIGNDPSMKDILRMCRPKPNSSEKNALFGYFLDRKVEFESLPEIVRAYEKWKSNKEGPVPDVDFRFLDSLGLSDQHWTEVAKNAPWKMTRMNLNTFARHNVFNDNSVIKIVADRLANREEIAKSMVFPYELFTAWQAIADTHEIPFAVRDSLQTAMEFAIDNVPAINGKVHVCVDCSGSMGSPITGATKGRPASKATCAHVAGLIASAVVRKNPSATVWTFRNDAVKVAINPRDSVMTNVEKLSRHGGGTDVASPLRKINEQKLDGDVIVYASDYESWIEGSGYGSGTGVANEWRKFKERNPKAKLICCDLTPRNNSQITTQKDVLQVGGWSDTAFAVMANFVEHGRESDHWVSEIEKVVLD
jgi:60 kDa SS-A/Ro ribonucleoprotein